MRTAASCAQWDVYFQFSIHVGSVEPQGGTEWSIPPTLQDGGPSGFFVRAPDIASILVQHQPAVIGQAKVTNDALVDSIGGPVGLSRHVVQDQVAISLHDQTNGARAICVGSPGGLPTVDDKVAVLLPKEQTDRNTVSPVHRRAAQILFLDLKYIVQVLCSVLKHLFFRQLLTFIS